MSANEHSTATVLLDVGCGPGSLTLLLARHVAGAITDLIATYVGPRRPVPGDLPGNEGSIYRTAGFEGVFVAEIDVAFDEADGRRTTLSLVQIFRLRDGLIAQLRDYFSEQPSAVPGDHPS